VVVSTRRLTMLEPVDGVAAQVTAGAGVSIGALQAHARAAGFDYGVDLAARDSATVGGTIATNAGGHPSRGVRRHRRQVLGVEAAPGRRHGDQHLSGLAKDNTGTTSRRCSPAVRGRSPWSRRRGCGWCRGARRGTCCSSGAARSTTPDPVATEGGASR
jgi:hypothetical protein